MSRWEWIKARLADLGDIAVLILDVLVDLGEVIADSVGEMGSGDD